MSENKSLDIIKNKIHEFFRGPDTKELTAGQLLDLSEQLSKKSVEKFDRSKANLYIAAGTTIFGALLDPSVYVATALFTILSIKDFASTVRNSIFAVKYEDMAYKLKQSQ